MLTGRIRPRARVLSALAIVGLLAGCGGSKPDSSSNWVAQPGFQAGNPNPQLPNPGIPEPSMPGNAVPPSASPKSGANAADPNVLASKLIEPTGLVVLPDGTALVGERRSGKVFRVQPTPGQPVVLVQTLGGVNATGDGGLLDLAVSPTFDQDGLIYAYLSTATDNRVVHFALGSAPSPVLAGIPHGSSDNSGRIAFDATGALLIGTGDAGRPALAASPTSLAGKILRTSDIGRPMPDNPVPNSVVYARGLRTVDGLCVDARSGQRIAVSAGSPDELNLITPAADYGWPHSGPGSKPAVKTLPAAATGGGGCALAQGHLVVATSTGKSLVTGDLSQSGALGDLTPGLHGTYGRLRTVLIAPDGALWLTTRNRDGHGTPVAADDRVVRISASDVSSAPVV